MTDAKLPAWPDKPTTDPALRSYDLDMSIYDDARAEAAIARLKVAESALLFIATSKFQYPPERLINEAALALAKIGDIPE
jgi:hypothetical protein